MAGSKLSGLPAMLLAIAITILLIYSHTPTYRQPRTTTANTSHQTREKTAVITIDKPIEEWKKLYREYLDKLVLRYEKNGWIIDDDLAALYSIIDSAGPGKKLVVLQGVDPVDKDIDNRIHIRIKLYVPVFAVELINRSFMLRIDSGVEDPCISAIAEAINKHIENTSSYGYNDFRKAYIIFTLVENRMYWSDKGRDPIHPLLALVRGYGTCETQTDTALALLSRAGLWSAEIFVKTEHPPHHVRPAVHVSEFPPWYHPPKPYIGDYIHYNKTNITFYAWEVTWEHGFRDREENTRIDVIMPPYDVWKKVVYG